MDIFLPGIVHVRGYSLPVLLCVPFPYTMTIYIHVHVICVDGYMCAEPYMVQV